MTADDIAAQQLDFEKAWLARVADLLTANELEYLNHKPHFSRGVHKYCRLQAPRVATGIIDMARSGGQRAHARGLLVGLLTKLDSLELAYLTLAACLIYGRNPDRNKRTVQALLKTIADWVTSELRLRELETNHAAAFEYIQYRKRNRAGTNFLRKFANKRFTEITTSPKVLGMSNLDAIEVSTLLLEVIQSTCGLFIMDTQVVAKHDTKTLAVLRPKMQQWLYQQSRDLPMALTAKHPPGILLYHPPLRQSWEDGSGYLLFQDDGPLVYSKAKGLKPPQLEEDAIAEMDRVSEVIQNLEWVPWQVNRNILDFIVKNRELLDKLGVLPAVELELPDRPQPGQTKQQWMQARKDIHDANSDRRLEIHKVEHTLEMARLLKDKDEFFLRWMLDLRGRLYTQSHTLTPQGGDLSRALVKFKNPKPFIKRAGGLDANRDVLIYVARYLGQLASKTPKEEVWTEDQYWTWFREYYNKLLIAGVDPDQFRNLWPTTEKPLMFLALCQELVGYDLSDNGTAYPWSVPIYQDATCSAVQHFALFTGDMNLASVVNLLPGQTPRDPYMEIAHLVMQRRPDLARYVSRSLVKPSVMTPLYGAKPSTLQGGIRKQVGADVAAELYPEIELATKDIVGPALDAYTLLKSYAKTIAAQGSIHENTLSSGFVASQLYLKWPSRKMRLHSLDRTIQISLRDTENMKAKVDTRKYVEAFVANYIHSMDANLVHATVLTLADEGILHFAANHDSFITTPQQAQQARQHVYSVLQLVYNRANELATALGYENKGLLDAMSKGKDNLYFLS